MAERREEIVKEYKAIAEIKTYWAHENALSRASKLPPIKGAGGFESEAIHQPTGILTVFTPCLYKKSKSSTVIKLFLCFCNIQKKERNTMSLQ